MRGIIEFLGYKCSNFYPFYVKLFSSVLPIPRIKKLMTPLQFLQLHSFNQSLVGGQKDTHQKSEDISNPKEGAGTTLYNVAYYISLSASIPNMLTKKTCPSS